MRQAGSRSCGLGSCRLEMGWAGLGVQRSCRVNGHVAIHWLESSKHTPIQRRCTVPGTMQPFVLTPAKSSWGVSGMRDAQRPHPSAR